MTTGNTSTMNDAEDAATSKAAIPLGTAAVDNATTTKKGKHKLINGIVAIAAISMIVASGLFIYDTLVPDQDLSNVSVPEHVSYMNSMYPSSFSTTAPTGTPSTVPSARPSSVPSSAPSSVPSSGPSTTPTRMPSAEPSLVPSYGPSHGPSQVPTRQPSALPSGEPSLMPSLTPSSAPTLVPSAEPSLVPSFGPSQAPTGEPSALHSEGPSSYPSSAPTGEPSVLPSTEPTLGPSSAPSFSPTKVPRVCGLTVPDILSVQEIGEASLVVIQRNLVAYTQPTEEEVFKICGLEKHHDRKLLIPVLKNAIFLFTQIFSEDGLGHARDGLSLAADGLSVFAFLRDSFSGSGATEAQIKVEEWRKKVLANQQKIITVLGELQAEQTKGFERLELLIKEQFAKEEMDELTLSLSELKSDFEDTQHVDLTEIKLVEYKKIFKNSCNSDHDPHETFKRFYSHACDDCTLFGGGKSYKYLLPTYLEMAYDQFPADSETVERVQFFRQAFGSVVISGMVEAMYLHAVCDEGICLNENPVRISQLEKMAEALEEVYDQISSAEQKGLSGVSGLCPLPSESPSMAPTPTPAPTLPWCSCNWKRCIPNPCRKRKKTLP